MKRNNRKRVRKEEQPEQCKPIPIYTDGSGSRPDGKGSAIAWFRADTQEEYVKPWDGLTNNEAEYRAILSALQALPKGSRAVILADSQLVIYQLRGFYRVYDAGLAKLRNLVLKVVAQRQLRVEFMWIAREHNSADRLLRALSTEVLEGA
jgi:ribonuclease HI